MANLVLQDIFLNQIRRDKIKVKILTGQDFEILGTIRGFDEEIVIIDTEREQIMLYKQNILSISTETAVFSEEKRQNR